MHVLVNAKFTDIIIYRDPTTGAVTLDTKEGACKWEPVANSTVDSVVGDGKGFFIAIDNNGGKTGTVNLNSGAVLKDMNYTVTNRSKELAPVWVNGGKLNINGGSIQNNTFASPKFSGDNNTYDKLFNYGKSLPYLKTDVSPAASTARYENFSGVRNNSVGAIIVEQQSGVVNINSGSLEGNGAAIGAIKIAGGATVNQNGGKITNNDGYNSGAVYVEKGAYNLHNGEVSYNTGWWNGTISAMNDEAIINIGTDVCDYPIIKNNETLCKGGAVYVNSDSVSIRRGEIKDNTALVYGGGIYVEKNNVLVLTNTAITNNTAKKSDKNSGGFGNDDISGAGGGVWACPTDKTYYNIENVHIWGNHLSGGNESKDGKDFYQVRPYYGSGSMELFDSSDNWSGYWVTGGKGKNNRQLNAVNGSSAIANALPKRTGIALANGSSHTLGSQISGCNATNESNATYLLRISGNEATNGGGVASNGVLAFVTNKTIKDLKARLKVTKDWNSLTDAEKAKIRLTVNIIDESDNTVAQSSQVELHNGVTGALEGEFSTIVKETDDSVTIDLPTIYTTVNGNKISVFEALGLSNNSANVNVGSPTGDVIDLNGWKIEITEEVWDTSSSSWVPGSNKYSVDLGALYADYKKTSETRELNGGSNTITVDHYDFLFKTEVDNNVLEKYGRLTLNKTDSAGNLITTSDATFKYKKVNADGSDISGETEKTLTKKSTGIYEVNKLREGYYKVWEEAAPTGYKAFDGHFIVKVDANGVITTQSGNSKVTGPTRSDVTDMPNFGGNYTYKVQNDTSLTFEIKKVGTNGVGISSQSAGNTDGETTEFQIWQVNQSQYKTIKFDRNRDSYVIDDVIAWFVGDGGFVNSNTDLANTIFYIKEVHTPNDAVYEASEYVVPFGFEYKNGHYEFKKVTDSDMRGNGRHWITYNSQTNITTVGKNGKVYACEIGQPCNEQTRIPVEEVKVKWLTGDDYVESGSLSTVHTGQNASGRVVITNDKKHVELELIKVDENGNKIAKDRTGFQIRRAAESGGIDGSDIWMLHDQNDKAVFRKTRIDTNGRDSYYAIWEGYTPTDDYVQTDIDILIKIDADGVASFVDDLSEVDSSFKLYDGVSSNTNREIWWPKYRALVDNGAITLNQTDGKITISWKNFKKTQVEVEKKWNLEDGQPKTTSITVKLLANGEVVRTGTLNENTQWKYIWTGLPEYKDGAKITYTVEEDVPDGYVATVSRIGSTVEKDCSDLTNIIGWKTLSVDNLEGKRFRIRTKDDNNIYIMRKVSDYGLASPSTDIDTYKDTNVLWEVSDVRRTYRNGVTYYNIYGLENVWASENSSKTNKPYLGYNSNNNKMVASAESPTITYIGSGTQRTMMYISDFGTKRYLRADVNNPTSTEWGGNFIFEEPIYENNRVCEITKTTEKFEITNTYQVIDLDVEKAWNDNNNAKGHRPDKITVDIFKNGSDEVYKTIEVSAPDWKGTFKDLAKYENGQLIEYTIKEREVDYYQGNTVTISSGSATGQSTNVVEGWTNVNYNKLDTVKDGFRIIVNDYVYYLDTSTTTPTLKTAKVGSAQDPNDKRSMWKVVPGTYENYYGYTKVQFQSVANPNYYITSRNKGLIAGTTPRTFTYLVESGEMFWDERANGGDYGWFNGTLNGVNCTAYFVTTQEGHLQTQVTATITNNYEDHQGLEIIKVGENGTDLLDGAEFTIYDINGATAPHTVKVENGKFVTDKLTDWLKKGCFYLMEETKTPSADYAKLETAIPIHVLGDGTVALVTDPNHSSLTGKYNKTTKILNAAGSGANARPQMILDFDLIGNNKMVSGLNDDKRLVLTVKNKEIDNELELLKYDSDYQKKLEDAKFSIMKVEKNAEDRYVQSGDIEYTIEEIEDGTHQVKGLKPGIYLIGEDEAPDQYIRIENLKIAIEVDDYGKLKLLGVYEMDTGTLRDRTEDDPVVINNGQGTLKLSLKVENEAITYTLPETGGLGTSTCIGMGSIMIIIGALLLGKKYLSEVRG